MSIKKDSFSLLNTLFTLIVSSLLMCRCTSKSGVVTNTDSLTVDTTEAQVAQEEQQDNEIDDNENQSAGPGFIHYNGALDNEKRQVLITFFPFVPVQELAHESIWQERQLQDKRQIWNEPLPDPEDTAFLYPFKEKAYQAIVAYKNKMAKGTVPKGTCPGLLDLTRELESEDSSRNMLPIAGPSNLLSDGKFFFLGGAPFISNMMPEGNEIFTDKQGKPETRFRINSQENIAYLFTSMFHFKPGPIEIEYGPPVVLSESGGGGTQEVRGIGSLIHKFVQRVPALFITKDGLIPAHLLSVELELDGGWPGNVTFACAASLDANEILAIYIPYNTQPLSLTIKYQSEIAWTADLNSDGIPDIGCVYDSHVGEISETLMEVLWFVNINGTWRVIDHAAEAEQT